MTCPACNYLETEAVIVDLSICNRCSHIFRPYKGVPRELSSDKETSYQRLHPIIRYTAGQILFVGPINYDLFNCAKNEFVMDVQNIPTDFDMNETFIYKFGCITLFNSFEYMRDPIARLSFLKERLTRNGVIIIELPMLVFTELEISPTILYRVPQAQYFTQDSLMETLRLAKLKPVEQHNQWKDGFGISYIIACKEEDFESVSKVCEVQKYG